VIAGYLLSESKLNAQLTVESHIRVSRNEVLLLKLISFTLHCNYAVSAVLQTQLQTKA